MPKLKNGKNEYEYFRENSETIEGKHKDYVDAMWTQLQIQKSYFVRLVDLYTVAAAIGIRKGLSSPYDPGTDGEKRTIQMDQLGSRLDTLENLMKAALLKDNTRGLSVEEKIDSAFRMPEDEETYRKNMNIFNSYVRGGIEYLYENLIKRTVTPDDEDYGDAKISNLVALINGFSDKTSDI